MTHDILVQATCTVRPNNQARTPPPGRLLPLSEYRTYNGNISAILQQPKARRRRGRMRKAFLSKFSTTRGGTSPLRRRKEMMYLVDIIIMMSLLGAHACPRRQYEPKNNYSSSHGFAKEGRQRRRRFGGSKLAHCYLAAAASPAAYAGR